MNLSERYFKWMINLVADNNTPYFTLLHYLHETDFNYTIAMDGNRADDGVNLRYRFGYENNISDSAIARFIDIRPCSVLEMMIALSIRMEEDIMCNPEQGNRISKWFWEMIHSLGLDSMSDENFNEHLVRRNISNFIERRYSRNGRGGLFTVRHCIKDMRNVEIWYQMCWYLDEVIKEEGVND